MSEAWPDIYDEGCIHQIQPDHLQNSLEAAEALSLMISPLQGSYRSGKSRKTPFSENILTGGQWKSRNVFIKSAVSPMQSGIEKCLWFLWQCDVVEHYKKSIYCLAF